MTIDRMAHPLDWPEDWQRTPPAKRREGRFRMEFGDARDALVRELRLMGAINIVLSTNIPIRKDGLPYKNHRQPEDPGVAVYWTERRKGQPLSSHVIACDQWDRVRTNLRAVGFAIEGLRMMQRSGANQIVDRAYQGFQALPSTAGGDWRQVFGFSESTVVTVPMVESLYRKLVSQRHPDHGGTHDDMIALNRAYQEAMKELTGR